MPPRTEATPKRWRENIESLTVAIVVALLFKYFILEISKIPSGSMQPTLMGNPSAGVFDRVVVDKLSFRYRDPKRFEIVVFKHPLERSRVMVKRLVGLPEEELKIENGDLWTRAGPGDAWTILRPAPPVQGEFWRALVPRKPSSPHWKPLESPESWRVEPGAGQFLPSASGPGIVGTLGFRPDRGGIRDGYFDGYPDALRKELALHRRPTGRHFVGDLRVEGEVRPTPSLATFFVRFHEAGRSYEFRVPGPAGPRDARPTVELLGTSAIGSPPPVEPLRLEGKTLFAAENLNDRLRLTLDGEEILAVDIPPAPEGRTGLEIGFEGGGGKLEDLRVYRDIYYLPPDGGDRWTVAIPEGHYVMLGDNTQDSADSRLWEQMTVRLNGTGLPEQLRGNYRQQENPVLASAPADDRIRFKDVWGEVHWLPRSQVLPTDGIRLDRTLSELGSIRREPLVPRRLIQGRAVCVFWPLKPHRGLWRLAWLH